MEAIAVRGGRIVAAGYRDEVMKLKGDKTRVVDLGGKTLVPGFIDPHGHVFNAGIQAISANLLPRPDGVVNDIPELQAALKAWSAQNEKVTKKYGWIVGFGYDDAQLKEQRHPTRDDLDKVSRERPVVIVHQSGHLASMNSKALEARKLFCVTQLDKVKIQFILRGLERIETKGGPAFRAALPDSVLRLQRREYYRLATPIVRPLKCVMAFPPENGEPRMLEAHIGDISGGGLGVVSIPLDIPIETGQQLGCRIDLPEVGVVTGTVAVRSVFESVARNGVRSQRAGCEFLKLPGLMLTLIQRYIIKVERERKARDSGMT